MFCTCCGAQVQISFAFCPSCGESLRNGRQASTDRGGSTCTENVTMETLRNSPGKCASSSGMDQSRPEVLPKTKRAELPTYAQFAAKVGRKTGAFQAEDVKTWKTCVADRSNYQHWFDGVRGGLKCI